MKIQKCRTKGCTSDTFDVEGTVRIKYLVCMNPDTLEIDDIIDEERLSDAVENALVSCRACGETLAQDQVELL